MVWGGEAVAVALALALAVAVAVAVAVASRSPSSGRPRFVGGAEALLGDAEEVLVAMVITMMGDDMDAAVSTYYVGLVAS